MSNEQTVREAFQAQSRGAGISWWHFDLMCEIADIDPDMSVSELQRRSRIADRVLDCTIETADAMPEPRALLAWLTREDDRPQPCEMTCTADPCRHDIASGYAALTREDDQ